MSKKIKLIKLTEDHYIIVDGSKIVGGDFVIALDTKKVFQCNKYEAEKPIKQFKKLYKKITHSTQPLENYYGDQGRTIKQPYTKIYHNIRQLSLSEIEEVINGYSVDKLAEKILISHRDYKAEAFSEYQNGRLNGIVEGIEAHQELTKDKLFTVEDMKKAFMQGVNYSIKPYPQNVHFQIEYEKSLISKTEWDIEFVDNKITLI